MTEIVNFDKCQRSPRAGTYGGKSGFKDGILYNGEYWLIKYPRTTKSMQGIDLSYTTAPLSEYLGSHVYQAVGFDTHETVLGEKDGKLVVGCKDFRANGADLIEIRTLKNLAKPSAGRNAG